MMKDTKSFVAFILALAAPSKAPPEPTTPAEPEEVRPTSRPYLILILQASIEHDVDPRLLEALIQVESGYNAKAVSPKGAMGLMQLMPATCREVGVTDPFDVRQNILGGARYLRSLLDAFDGDVTLALAANNAGPTAVRRHDGVPPYPETINYLKAIQSILRERP